MNELPQPATPVLPDPSAQLPSSQGVPAQTPPPQEADSQTPSSQGAVSSDMAQGADAKLLQQEAARKIEQIILQTPTDPLERSNQIHAVKSAFLKAQYGIDTKDVVR
ncbi:hypothetical protein CSA80_04100 [Candidatus Saccharibacteria bacterium]|nr:MAG: hypothetical protein CR973_01825 [Candidatus Saccharibacteria bacterium]PID98858.1 MAG: hypothetical protein CSA80_04100 [Candidatus Saccharibacteria bacterium]